MMASGPTHRLEKLIDYSRNPALSIDILNVILELSCLRITNNDMSAQYKLIIELNSIKRM